MWNENQEHTEYPLSDWQYEVQCGYTRLGYVEWVQHSIERDRIEGSARRNFTRHLRSLKEEALQKLDDIRNGRI